MQQKLSVIVTNFNYSQYIPRCLESLLSQKTPFHQIIVVDDGSTDDSRKVLERYSERVTVIYKENGGPLSCYYAAFDILETNYFCTIDADDWAYPELVNTILPRLERHPAKIQFQLQGVSAQGDLGTIFPPFPNNYTHEKILEDNISIGFYISPPTSGNVFSKKLITKVSLEQWGSGTNIDGTPSLVMPYMGEIITIYQPLVHYFIHDKNISGVGVSGTAPIQRQIDAFLRRWKCVNGLKAFPVSNWTRKPAYLAERYLLLAARGERRFFLKEIWAFISGILRTHYAAKQKFMLTCWALAFAVPVKEFQNYLADIRMNGTKRPVWLKLKNS